MKTVAYTKHFHTTVDSGCTAGKYSSNDILYEPATVFVSSVIGRKGVYTTCSENKRWGLLSDLGANTVGIKVFGARMVLATPSVLSTCVCSPSPLSVFLCLNQLFRRIGEQ